MYKLHCKYLIPHALLVFIIPPQYDIHRLLCLLLCLYLQVTALGLQLNQPIRLFLIILLFEYRL